MHTAAGNTLELTVLDLVIDECKGKPTDAGAIQCAQADSSNCCPILSGLAVMRYSMHIMALYTCPLSTEHTAFESCKVLPSLKIAGSGVSQAPTRNHCCLSLERH